MSGQFEDGSVSAIELIKRNSNGLRGNLLEELSNDEDSFTGDSEQVLKFHGIYNQDNRDVRSERKRAGLDLEHICMVRLALPGGRLSAQQYLAIDSLSDLVGNGSLRITTRQGIQFHFVSKQNVRNLIKQVNDVLITTYAGCGDVVRNVTACPSPSALVEELGIGVLAQEISKRYKPRSNAYYEIWIDGEKVDQRGKTTDEQTETVYGDSYLPRKFKIGLTSTDDNCIDVLSCDLALVLSKEDPDRINVFAGGGLGKSHSDDTTKALLAKPLTYVSRGNLFNIIDNIIGIQRDYGDRKDRSHARFKYLVESWGTAKLLEELKVRVGHDLPVLEEMKFSTSEDHLGWTVQRDELVTYGIKLPSGRIIDSDNSKYRSALREIVRTFSTSVRFTAKEDVLVGDINPADKDKIIAILKAHNVPTLEEYSLVSLHAFACPALPTCGLALTESERYLPTFLDNFKELTDELGLETLDIEVRMTGCPNGCARPYLGEIGLVGRSKRSYDIYLGADKYGNRLSDIYATDVLNDSLIDALRPILELYAKESIPKEGFGDFCNRVGLAHLRTFAPEPRRRRVPVS